MRITNQIVRRISAGFDILNNLFKSREVFFRLIFFYPIGTFFLGKFFVGTGLVELAKSRRGGVPVLTLGWTSARFDKLTVLSKLERMAVSTCSPPPQVSQAPPDLSRVLNIADFCETF
jgi:hypothetical protein